MQQEPERLTMAAFVHPQAFWRASPEPGCATQTGQHQGLCGCHSAQEPDKEMGQSGCGGRVPCFPRCVEAGVSIGHQGKMPGMVGGKERTFPPRAMKLGGLSVVGERVHLVPTFTG